MRSPLRASGRFYSLNAWRLPCTALYFCFIGFTMGLVSVKVGSDLPLFLSKNTGNWWNRICVCKAFRSFSRNIPPAPFRCVFNLAQLSPSPACLNLECVKTTGNLSRRHLVYCIRYDKRPIILLPNSPSVIDCTCFTQVALGAIARVRRSGNKL